MFNCSNKIQDIQLYVWLQNELWQENAAEQWFDFSFSECVFGFWNNFRKSGLDPFNGVLGLETQFALFKTGELEVNCGRLFWDPDGDGVWKSADFLRKFLGKNPLGRTHFDVPPRVGDCFGDAGTDLILRFEVFIKSKSGILRLLWFSIIFPSNHMGTSFILKHRYHVC